MQHGESATPTTTTASPDDSLQTLPPPAIVKKEDEEYATSLPPEDIKPKLSRLPQDKVIGVKLVIRESADSLDKKRKREADQESEESGESEGDENFAAHLEAELAALRAAHSPTSSVTMTKSVSAQTNQAEQVSASTSTSTDAAENAASVAHVPSGSIERVVAPLPSRQASPVNDVAADDPPAPQPAENVVLPPAAEIILDDAVADHRGPDLEAPPVVVQHEAIIAHAPEARVNDRRPTKRTRLGTFLLGAIAGSVASIGALASYGAGDLD